MEAKYNRGDYVRYACNGVCRVDDIRREARPGTREETEFYILKPVASSGGTIFVPTENPVLLGKMQPLTTAEEIDGILTAVKEQPAPWLDDRKARTAAFQTVLKQSDLREMIEMVSCLYHRRQAIASRGRKLSSSDESVLRRAEGLVANELAFVLQIEEKLVGPYIREKLGISE